MMSNVVTEAEIATPGPIHMIVTMCLAGLLSGLIIVSVYEATLPTIMANKAKAMREAAFQVLPGVTKVQRWAWRDNKLVVAENGPSGEEAMFAGFDANDQLVGYALPGAGPGFQDIISLLYGYRTSDQRIIGLRILDSRETPGLGDKIFKDRDFQLNFTSLAVTPDIKAVKKGTKAAPNEIDAITGATISSKAVVKILNTANATWLPRLASIKITHPQEK